MLKNQGYRFSVAPMMDWTDRHCRVFHRALCGNALLYTEMVTADAIIHGDRARLLDFDAAEHPVALQLGGSSPEKLAQATAIGAEWGYGEINLNVGCPSDRVQSGYFGAALMADPGLVAECLAAMHEASAVPVTLKCRIGIDDQTPEETLPLFLEVVAHSGIEVVIIHARKALLKGLSPKENRTVPPLNYPLALAMKRSFPHLRFVLNGGIETLDQARAHLEGFDGVMLGRAAYQNPAMLLGADAAVFGNEGPPRSRGDAVRAMLPYIEKKCAQGTPLVAITRHMLGLFNGLKGARAWRRLLSEEARAPGSGPELVARALESIEHQQAEGWRDAALA